MVLVFVIFLILLFAGMPVAFSAGISGIFYFLQHPEMPFNQFVQLTLTQTQNVALLSIPMFITAGNLMNASGITHRLLHFAGVLTQNMRGGMAQTSVVLSTLMGGVSGSSVADAAMEARILGPNMIQSGYSRAYTAVVIGFTSLITATIPPGNNLILYGIAGEVSIGRLFMGGLAAGLLMMTMLMITVAITARIKGYKAPSGRRATVREILQALSESVWAVIFPIILLVGIRFGWFTPSEVGAFACIYALLVGVVAYREIGFKGVLKVLRDSAADVGGIMFLIACTGPFGYGIPVDRVPQALTRFVLGITDSALVVQLIIVGVLLVAGMFMEGGVIILILTPIFLPMVKSLGVDPVFFGILMSTTCLIGILTPPVGLAMYIVNGLLGVKLKDYIRESIPFMIAVILELMLLMCFPRIITFLPNLIYR